MFLGAPEAFGVSFYEKITAHLTMSSLFPKNIDARFTKSSNAHQWRRRAQVFAAYKSNVKENRHRKQHSGNSCQQQAIVWGLSDDLHGYKFSYIAVQIKFRNTLLTTERLVAASEGRMSDIAFKAIHEQEEWATGAPVCRAFGPLRDKGHKRKTLIKYKWTIKVEYSREI